MFERFPAELQAMVDLLFEAREIMSSPNQVAFPQAKASVLPQEMFSPPLPDVRMYVHSIYVHGCVCTFFFLYMSVCLCT